NAVDGSPGRAALLSCNSFHLYFSKGISMFFTKSRVRAALVAGAAAGALLLTSCAGAGGDGDAGATSADGPKFIYITSDPNGQNDFLKSGKVGLDSVAEQFEGSAKTDESKD